MQPSNSSDSTPGFQQSVGRSFAELAIIVGVLIGLVLGVIWIASRATDWLLPLVPKSLDQKVGQMSWEATRLSQTECDDESMKLYVQELIQVLAQAAKVDAASFHVAVVEDASPNAAALPGGYLLVHSGLMTTAKGGAEVAAVLAHEMGHVEKRHGMRRVLRSLGASVLVNSIFGGTDVMVLAEQTSNLTHLAYDRDQEREADEWGQEILVQASISPAALGTFFERLQADEARNMGKTFSFLSTHPDMEERIAAAKLKTLPGAERELRSTEGLRCKKESAMPEKK